MLKALLVGGMVVWSGLASSHAADDDEVSAAEAPMIREERESIIEAQAEVLRIEREVADLAAILEAQKALIEYRRAGGDASARLDARLCLRSGLRDLCKWLGETFGQAAPQ